MRYLFGFLCVCALGVVPLVGCGEETDRCTVSGHCWDDNVCTVDTCVDGSCDHVPVYDRKECDLDGVPGVCISGVCGENPCDDASECTWDLYRPDGSCFYITIPTGSPCDWNGESGVCIDGVCEQDPCKGVVCDDGDLCTRDWCVPTDTTALHYECGAYPVSCSDGNDCTDDGPCDPDTGECDHTTLPDGTDCCITGGTCCSGFIPICSACCVVWGVCHSGVCVG